MVFGSAGLVGVLLVALLGHWLVLAQNTDAGLRFFFPSFTLELGPSGSISCNSIIAETVLTLVQDCLDTLNSAQCADLFPRGNPPERVLLGGAECVNEFEIYVSGGAMDFAVSSGIVQPLVNQCVDRILSQGMCLSALQSTFSGVSSMEYTVDTPAPTFGPTVSPTYAPTDAPTATPSASPSVTPPVQTTDTSTPAPVVSTPNAKPTSAPVSPVTPGGAVIEDQKASERDALDDQAKVGLYVGAAAFCACLALLLLLVAARKRGKVEEEVEVVKDTDLSRQPSEGFRTVDTMNSQPPGPPPLGILHRTNSRGSQRRQPNAMYSLPDDYSAQGYSVGDPELTLISSVDMASTDDGSESFVDQTRMLNQTISKDMLGGSSEVPKNRNPMLARLGASATPHLVRSSSSSDDGDSQPRAPFRKKEASGFYRLDDDDDSFDDELAVNTGVTEPSVPSRPEDFAQDPSWDPDDSEHAEDVETGDFFGKESTAEGIQFEVPPELKDGSRRKSKSGTPRSILGGNGRSPSPSVRSSSGYSI